MVKRFLKVFIFLIQCGSLGAQDLVINEVMSSNDGFLLDENGDTPDWLELYNPSEAAVPLAGYHISDTESDYFKFTLPDTSIAPHGFLLLFASGKNRAERGAEIHTNFAVSANGESLILTRDGVIVHQMDVPPMDTDLSFGLAPDGGIERRIFYLPTPGQQNSGETQHSVRFSHVGGIYELSTQLGLTSSLPQGQIRYTTDGSTPTSTSALYTDSLSLNSSLTSKAEIFKIKVSSEKNAEQVAADGVLKCIVIRAAVFDQAGRPVSPTFTNTYLIKSLGSNHHDLPVISIVASHKSLFDTETGIFVPGVHWDADDPHWTGNYYETGDAWEREINFEYFEPTGISLNQRAGLRIHGGYTRHFPQKGMRLYARGEYGISAFDHPFFEENPVEQYSRLVLKPFSSSWTQAGIEDYLCARAAATLNIDVAASKPVVVYLNGEYWGIYFLQERIDERFIAYNEGVAQEQVDMAEGWGGPEIPAFDELYKYIEESDLSSPEAYEAVARKMDIDNFIDYEIFQIFSANKDWPANNVRSWRERNDSSLRRWIFQDGDATLADYSFDAFANALYTGDEVWPTSEGATLFLRKMMENEDFRNRFTGRLQHLLANELGTDSLEAYYRDVLIAIQNEIGAQIDRFSYRFNPEEWGLDMDNLSEFIKKRPCVVAKQYNERFNTDISIPYDCVVPSATVSDINIYPNPNKGLFTTEFEASISGGGMAFIHDVHGNMVSSQPIIIYEGKNLISIDTGLATGLYLIRLVSDKVNFSARFMVE
ncbi:CotH kinase family protein [Imperialibacter roseus]|uniref:CotH kinase family protein n=1 Tax=Imperialibacter roseus TaxID=1324217 RepID=A0ABZ0IM69_9BACT|nr:CotH kinase family protein [Imperialibacter roseus]WOK05249.1 CotH kinase family protein [Imperialibacter roseus]